MTLFAAQAATDPGQVALAKLLAAEHTHDPAIRQQWCEDAEQERDQTRREFVLEDRADNGLVMRRWRMQNTPTAAWWWFRTTTCPPGHRIVMTEVKP